MKNSFLILSVILIHFNSNAQNTDYGQLWKNVEKFESKDLPKSALAEVEKIYTLAKAQQNKEQIIKSFLYKSKYQLHLQENARLKIISDLKKEIRESEFPTTNILESILADLYWLFFQENRYKFYERTQTDQKVDPADFRTWDLQTLFEETNLHYQNSLINKVQLQKIPVRTYAEILTLEKDSELYRPALYDLLAHRAIDFYRSGERNIQNPTYKFTIEDPDLLKDNAIFLKTKLHSKDSLSQELNALLLYKDLTRFHLKDKDPSALISLTLERMRFVKDYAVFENKETIYLSSLKKLKDHYKTYPASSEISFAIARLYNRQADNYIPLKSTEDQFKRKEALEICNQVLKEYPKTRGAKKCKVLTENIRQKNLNLQIEKYIPVNTPSRLLINYRKIDHLNFKVFKSTHIDKNTFNRLKSDSLKKAYIARLKPKKQWRSQFKNEHDYQRHSTEILLPAEEAGTYLIVTQSKEDLKKDSLYAYQFYQVTDLSLVRTNEPESEIWQVTDRNTGKPIKNARVHVKSDRHYANKKNRIDLNLNTDKNGYIRFEQKNDDNLFFEVSHKGDQAFFGNYYLNSYDYWNQKDSQNNYTKAFLFTDRSIYRPGQIVYFKGIVIQTTNDRSNVLSNTAITATLYNVNNENIKELKLITNEYGSVSGEFILPSGGLTGQYYIEIDKTNRSKNDQTNDFNIASTFFSVEEYKRPKFETKFKPVTESFQINDKITVKGEAISFSGAKVSDAKVKFRVVRTEIFPSVYRHYPPYPRISAEQEITHGETATDVSGNYQIMFKAIPDLKISKALKPVFNYTIYADVTDINGETHSTETTVRVAFHLLKTEITISKTLDQDLSDNKIGINSSNLNGAFVPVKGKLQIYELKAPDHILRKRPWKAPDYPGFTREDFKKLFPYDAYSNENDPETWKKGNLVFEKAINTGNTKEILLGNIKNWKPGKYTATFTCTDRLQQIIENEKKFDVYSHSKHNITNEQLIRVTTDKASYQPGEKALITFASAAKDLYVSVRIEKEHKTVLRKIIHLSENAKTVIVPVTEKDTGGFTVFYHTAFYNSFVSGKTDISVPYPETDLQITTHTFRDKILPGSDQQWSFHITGPKKEKIAAEMLASMYDASLDQFKMHHWRFSPLDKPVYQTFNMATARNSFGKTQFNVRNLQNRTERIKEQEFDRLNLFGLNFYNIRIYNKMSLSYAPAKMKGGNDDQVSAMIAPPPPPQAEMRELDEDVTQYTDTDADISDPASDKGVSFKNVKARTNFKETAFFYPDLKTDKDGNISFNFTVPEALTGWKLQLLAHTKDLKTGYQQLSTVTQKELMVVPNVPRFLRETDTILISSKITNLSDQKLNGIVQILLTDALTGQDITGKLLVSDSQNKDFSTDPGNRTSVSWKLYIPKGTQAVQYRIVAKAGAFSDGEQNILPVLSNRMLVTETLSMQIRGNEKKTFTLEKLKNNTSKTLTNHKLTLEITSNPVWTALQAMPYLMEFPYECSEQIFSRYFANSLAAYLMNSSPKIEDVFKQWRSSGALISNLEKNQELKSMLIQETPWLRNAQSETEQRKRLALLFDLNKMENEQNKALSKLKQMQRPDGGFPWFSGGHYANRNITQHIVIGLGKLNRIIEKGNKLSPEDYDELLKNSISFLDREILNDYDKLITSARELYKKEDQIKAYLKKNHTGNFQIQYLYMRSLFKEIPLAKKYTEAVDYYRKQSYQYWTGLNLYSRGLVALTAKEEGDLKIATGIYRSLKERSINSEETGMYWKVNKPDWHWYQSPVQTQSVMIEVFEKMGADDRTLDNLKLWLLRQKQTNSWKTTKATTSAVYAILTTGSDWLDESEMVHVKIGDQTFDPLQLEDSKPEAGTGYFKTSWNTAEIQPEMAEITLGKTSGGVAFGGLYWQYFEDLDRITPAKTGMVISKSLFLKKNTDEGLKLYRIDPETLLKTGDLITVRIEIRSDREMEFIHLKDMRASGFEPVNTLSEYKYQDNLYYYESTRDASTNFFIDRLPKGVFVFEYDLRVNNKGNFSNGITTLQSMYAPEFSSHSKGIRVRISD